MDASTGKPISGAQVTAGSATGTSAPDGTFTLQDREPGDVIQVEDCAYSPVSITIGGQSGLQTFKLQPQSVSGEVTSNLTHKGIPAHIKADGLDTEASGKGAFKVAGVCPGDTLRISAPGYSATRATVPSSRSMTSELEADPATTYEQNVAWDRLHKFGLECALLHPDTRVYISETQCNKNMNTYADQGYQLVSIKVKSVNYVTWTFSSCTLRSFGPKTYKHTAAINYTIQQSSPSGGVTPISGIAHWVQTKDGLWRWFPVEGCSIPSP